eukprot:COSAG02_NODE_1309_length_13330_cov_61.652483_14_plen_79_part_00
MLASITSALAPHGAAGTGRDSTLIDLQRGSTENWLVQVVQVGDVRSIYTATVHVCQRARRGRKGRSGMDPPHTCATVL